MAALLVGLLTVALFAPTWNHQMLFWDDDENVLQNPLVVKPLTAGLTQIFTAPFSTDYYPLTYISLALDHAVWRGHFFGYHVTQTLLHGANAFLVVLLVWRWTEVFGVALLAGAWFGWHPVQVETVAWIAERKNVLGTFLFLLAWLAYLNAGESQRGGRWRLAALGLFMLAALTHALVIVMPGLLIAYEMSVRGTRFTEALRRTWLFFVPAAFAALLGTAVVGLAGAQQVGGVAGRGAAKPTSQCVVCHARLSETSGPRHGFAASQSSGWVQLSRSIHADLTGGAQDAHIVPTLTGQMRAQSSRQSALWQRHKLAFGWQWH